MNDYQRLMEKKSSQELFNIIHLEKNNYETEAVEAAEKVLASRNPDPEEMDQLSSGLKKAEIVIAEKNEKRDEPLDKSLKVLCFIFPFVINFIIAGFVYSSGYKKKAHTIIRFTFYGWIPWTILAFIAIITSN